MARRRSFMEKNFYILQIEENEELAIQIEKMIMEKHEFVTKSKIIKSGEEAIEEIQKKLPDFILLNQKLSGMTGLEMLEKCNDLKIKLPQVVVIVDENITHDGIYPSFKVGIRCVLLFIVQSFQGCLLKQVVGLFAVGG